MPWLHPSASFGTTYGGDGVATFGLPNMQALAPIFARKVRSVSLERADAPRCSARGKVEVEGDEVAGLAAARR